MRLSNEADGLVIADAVRFVLIPSSLPPRLAYVHTDHLGTPRAVLDPQDRTLWRWEGEAFGASAPDENPSALGRFAYPLRFPGQYYDAESGMHYNLFRDYDPSIGRYVQSDPIGLEGGINTYSYVDGDPISYADPLGLKGTSGSGTPGFYPITPNPPRPQLCRRWQCDVCENTCNGTECKRFYVNAPANSPGSGGFFGNGGYAGDASKMKECQCVSRSPFPM